MPGIEEYYRGKTLLITGGTGLVGKVLLESGLRKLPVRKIYLLIRPRRDEDGTLRSAAERLRSEILASSAFDGVRAAGDDPAGLVPDRVEAVEGDLALDGLGLRPEMQERLLAEVDVVINSGALAVFDAPLDEALETNALGPLRVLEFARRARTPPFVAHVSTCYVNRLVGPAFETSLDSREALREDPDLPSYDVDEEVRAIRERLRGREMASRERRKREGMARARRRGWNDAYTFTKAMGEQLFVRHRGDVPGLILRPSILESALYAPTPGWIDGFRMMDPLIVAFARGQLFEFPGNPEAVVDVVPADMAANALLAAIPWSHAGEGPGLYQVASGMENPLLLRELAHHVTEYFERWPLASGPDGATPPPRLGFPETRPFLRQLRYRYLLPLRLAQAAVAPLRVLPPGRRLHEALGKRRTAVERLRHYAYLYGPYTESQARFLSFNARELWGSLSEAERETFPFDVRTLDWRAYVQDVHLPGIETHLLGMRPEERRAASRPVPVVASALVARGAGEGGGHGDGGASGDGRGAPLDRRRPAPEAAAPASSARLAAVGARVASGMGDAWEASPDAGPDEPGEEADGGTPADGGRGGEVPADGPAWTKAQRVLALAEHADPAEVERWTSSIPTGLLRKASLHGIRAIARYYLRLECTGRGHLPERGPFIVASNHASHVDTGVLLAALGELADRTHPAAAADYWFRNPVVGWLLRGTLGAIPFDRNAQHLPRALALAAQLLREGRSLIFFPEGGRSVTGELRPFKSSVGLLALASAAPIVPVHIQGSYEALPKGRSIMRPHPVRVAFGPRIRTEPYLERLDREGVGELARALAEDAHAAVQSLRDGSPPASARRRAAALAAK